ncbi:hypothetical protein EDB89DRAFT_2242032 [Lactarius sanguifluus]|nr:hypothetical protein EDB89DRAFT_2242032 [Lactarius sanguifluus]
MFPTLVATHTKFRAMPKHAWSFATTLIPWPTLPVPDPPNLSALACGPIPSTTMRPRSLWTCIRQLALRGGLRDTEQRFTTPKTLIIISLWPVVVTTGSTLVWLRTSLDQSVDHSLPSVNRDSPNLRTGPGPGPSKSGKKTRLDWTSKHYSYYEEYDHYKPSVLPHLRPKPVAPLTPSPSPVQKSEQGSTTSGTQDEYILTNAHDEPPSPTTCPPTTPLEYGEPSLPSLLHCHIPNPLSTINT